MQGLYAPYTLVLEGVSGRVKENSDHGDVDIAWKLKMKGEYASTTCMTAANEEQSAGPSRCGSQPGDVHQTWQVFCNTYSPFAIPELWPMGAHCSSGGLSRRGRHAVLTQMRIVEALSGQATRYRAPVRPVSMSRGNELQPAKAPMQVPNVPDLLTSQSQFEPGGQDPTS